MARTINASTLTEIENYELKIATLIYFELSADVYLTDRGHDISYGGNTYQASSHLLSVANVNESSDIRVNSLDIELSGVDQAYIASFLGTSYIGRQVIIYKAFLDDNGAIIGAPVMFYDGRIDGFSINQNDKTATLNVSVASHWSDFEKKSGRYTNPNSQELFFSGDKGFDFAAFIVKDLKWGKK